MALVLVIILLSLIGINVVYVASYLLGVGVEYNFDSKADDIITAAIMFWMLIILAPAEAVIEHIKLKRCTDGSKENVDGYEVSSKCNDTSVQQNSQT